MSDDNSSTNFEKPEETSSRIFEKTSDASAKIFESSADASTRIFETLAEQGRRAAEQGLAASQEFFRKFGAVGAPAPDLQDLIGAHQRNLEAFASANRIAVEGAQAVARRQTEILQQINTELAEVMQALASAEAPGAKAAKQTELVKHSYERAIANVRELRDLIAQANGEAVELLNRRFLESLDEIKALVERAS